MDDDADCATKAAQCFIDRVVDQLLHHVVEARAVIGISNVHARPFTDCVESFEYFDACGVVTALVGHPDPLLSGVCGRSALVRGYADLRQCVSRETSALDSVPNQN